MGERTADEMLPLIAHLDDQTVLREGGVQIRIYQISGLPWELETNREIGRLTSRLNALWSNAADPRLTVGVHVCKLLEHNPPQAGELRHTWPRQFDTDYRERVLGAGLSRNVIYVSLAFEAGARVGRRVGRLFSSRDRRPGPEDLRRFSELCAMVERDLAPYGILPLGLRAERRPNGVLRWYSQVAEAVGVVLYGRYQRVPMPATGSRLGRAILRNRPIFVPSAKTFEIRIPGVGAAARYHGTMYGFTAWPEATEPGILNNLLDFPGACVMTVTFGFRSHAEARNRMKVRQGQSKGGGEEEEEDAEDIGRARKEHHRRFWALGRTHMSVALYADTLSELHVLSNEMNTRLVNAGFHPAQEDLNLDAAWAAQAPGSWHKIKRSDDFTSRNFAAVAPLHNYPYGDENPLWGDYVADFRTMGGTLYRHNLHRGEVGSAVLFGMSGEGKSVLANMLMIGAVDRLGARGVVFDKDLGSKPAILGMGGSYLELRYGEPSGLAPLKAAENTPGDLGHLLVLFKGCIRARAPRDFDFSSDEDTRLVRGLATQLQMPPDLRSWAGVRQVLGWRNAQGAGAWLEAWCEGGSLGWVFANERDEADLTRNCAGFDTTALLRHPDVCGPLLAHLSYRVSKLAKDGSPFVLFWDEVPQALKVPQFEDMIGDNLSTIRKLNGVVILASQGPAALLDSKIGPIIREQTPTKISFANKDASWDEYAAIGFTPVMFRMVTEDFTVGPKRFVISRAGASVVCDFDLTPIARHLWMLSGRASTGRELDRIRAEVGDDPDVWVPLFLERAPLAYARAVQEAARLAADKERQTRNAKEMAA